MKTRKIISTLISVIMLMQVLMTGTFTASAQTTIETLATPRTISYSDNTITWTHNKENIRTFRVNFYALSTDGEYFHLQSNYDGDLKTNISFSLYDELWAHFNECMETFELNPETTDILANVEALSNNEELYRSSGVSDWVSLKSGTTYPPLGNDSDIPTNPTTEVLDWCGAYLGKAEYSKVQGCINYETILYKDGVRIDTFRTTWYDGQRNSVIRNLSEKMTESGVYYFVGRACDSQWNIVAQTKSNNYVYTNGQLIAPQNLHVENGILKWTNSPSTECTGYKLEVWYSNNNIAGTKLGTENITGDVVIKELFERYDFDSMSSKTYAFTENLNVRVIAYSDNPAYQDSPSDYYIIEPIAVGTTDSRASYRIYWNNKLSIQGSRNYGGDISDNFLSGTLSEYSSDIKTVSINDYINSIGEKAFYNADNLEKLDVNYGVSTFGKEAFAECDNLSSVNFSWSGQQSISFEEKVFYNCDKLESITGYNVNISKNEFIKCVNEIGVSVISQTEKIAIADKKIYALRDKIVAVDSIPLIASSIMSKKIASGAEIIVIDLKVGKGAFMKDLKSATKLAKTMIKIGKQWKKKVVVILSDMNSPLGNNIGNALEIKEVIDFFEGKREKRLERLALVISSYMIMLGKNISYSEAYKLALNSLKNNKAKEIFNAWINYQQKFLWANSVSYNLIMEKLDELISLLEKELVAV